MSWPVEYDKLNEKWYVGEYKPGAPVGPNEFFFRTTAERSVLTRTTKQLTSRLRPTTNRDERDDPEYDTAEPGDLWPGGFVKYAESRG